MKKKIVAILAVVILGGLGIWRFWGSKNNEVSYQTGTVARGAITVTISASGTVATANSAEVTTEASGVVKKIYKQNGEKVRTGEAVAELELDMEGQQRQSQALASYQSTQNNLYSLQSTMLTKWKTYMDIAQSGTYQNSDGSPKTDARRLPQFVSTDDDWLAAEASYKNQQNTINQAALAYQQASPVIYAPISGTLTGFGLQIGSVITAQSNSSGGSTAQKIASVTTEAVPTVKVSLTEVDAPKIKMGQKVTLTFDAFSGKTYTGKVISVDTVGSVSSGVTTYPTIIKLDIMAPEILTNMSAQANIILDSKADVLLVPNAAVADGTATVMVNGRTAKKAVETGLVSATQTEIISGLSEGEVIVMRTATRKTTTAAPTTSVFGGLGGGGFRGR